MAKQASLGADCPIDVDKLVESKLLVQANSGAGKSWSIRRIAEQTYGKVQQIIIDHDGEYHTLAEQFDYVIARKGGDVPVDIKSAALLARRLLELGVSAIVDIYELGTQRAEFVRRFIDAITNSPRDLWHPCIVVIDEAHLYCPEKGSSVSADAVKQFMSLGRKRGFAGVLATQRIAKLDKDAAAECNSKLIGRSALDVDMKRAADELGFSSKEDTRSLRTLKPGQFYVFGPAFADEVKLIQVGDVKTTHLRAGQRAMAPPAPRDKVKKILAQLKDLPHEAEQEAKTVAELQQQVKQLRADLKKAQSTQPAPKTETKIVEKAIVKPAELKRLEALLTRAEKIGGGFMDFNKKLYAISEGLLKTTGDWHSGISALTLAVNVARNPQEPVALPVKQPAKAPSGFKMTNGHEKPLSRSTPGLGRAPVPPPKRASQTIEVVDAEGPLPAGEQAVLRALIQYPKGLQRSQLTVLTGYARSSRDAYISRLKQRGLVETNLVYVFATDAGRAAMPDAEPLPTGEALREHWYGTLPEGERVVLQRLVEAYPEPVERTNIDEMTGYARSSRDAYLSRLRAKQLVIDIGRGAVKAADTLFEVGE